MTRAFSVYLDAMRVFAAFAVLASHAFIPYFHQNPASVAGLGGFGPDAVIMFFVISGFVVAYAAEEKDRTVGRYLFSRATRIYSVFIPAVILTWCVMTGLEARAPDVADRYQDLIAWGYLMAALTVGHEWMSADIQLGVNRPLWSLSYEFAYYLIFAAVFFARGARRIFLVLTLAVIAGVNVLLLAPSWLFGVMVYRASRNPPARRPGHYMIAVAAPVIYLIAYGGGVNGALRETVAAIAEGVGAPHFARSDDFLWHLLVGALFAAHLNAMLSVLRGPGGGGGAPDAVSGPGRAIRWLAGGTFSLYVAHFPVMAALDAILGRDIADPLRVSLIALGGLVGGYVFAELFERPLPRFRKWFADQLALNAARK